MSSRLRDPRADLTGSVIGAAAGLGALGLMAACFAPILLWGLFALAAAAAGAWVAYRSPVGATLAWLALVGSTPEMWLGELTGAEPLIVAGVKLAGIAVALLCAARYGAAPDMLNPAIGFLVIFAAGFTHRPPAGLDLAESLRTLIGSVAPFAFFLVRLPADWSRAVIRAVRWLPLAVCGFGCVLAIVGVRPLFVVDNGFRLQASSHPAFLAGFALAATEACLLELLRDGRRGDLALLGVNLLVLVLTGARAPLAIAVGVSAITMLAIPSAAFPARRRVTLALAAACLLPPLIVLASALDSVRLFQMLDGDAGSLSGRDLLWPWFARAWESAPWLGWGAGAAKTVLREDSLLVRLVGTMAPHNEYLRIGVEGGWLGLGLLIGLLAAWTIGHTRRLPLAERWFLRLVMLAFAIHSYTDNTLIATTSSVLFAFLAAAFARGVGAAASAGTRLHGLRATG